MVLTSYVLEIWPGHVRNTLQFRKYVVLTCNGVSSCPYKSVDKMFAAHCHIYLFYSLTESDTLTK